MKLKIGLIIAVFALAAAIFAAIEGGDAVRSALDDAILWFNYFAGPIRRG